ncbi:hypothetical protein CHS0354_023228 [Potamilus streckersoni]|uniref:CTCK domain-containing protein n=1 Tax=Potamilus streckersoni TaxID=2493646 RepID=A0AAE0SJP7_9BIVA|nr:hypothetical protein CHS0354_023228 [Potamilus streckersoni]
MLIADPKIYIVAVTSTILFGVCFCLLPDLPGIKDASTCKTETMEMEITSEEVITEQTGNTYHVTCSEKIQTTKCEGTCESNVTPSVSHFDGLKRVCSCCREGDTMVRDVHLSKCYHGDSEIPGITITRTVTQPISCQCQDCTVN